MSGESSSLKKVLIFGSLLSFILTIVLNGVLNVPSISPFNVTIGDLSHKYPTPITPGDSTFGIWGFIYTWQLALVGYSLSLLCRKCDGKPLYISPGVVPSIFYFSYIINLLGNVGWIFVWLQEELNSSLLAQFLELLTLVVCLASSCAELDKSGPVLEKNKLNIDIWCTRLIVQNGIAFYLAWISCATAINFITTVHYSLGLDIASTTYITLALLTAFLLGWFIAELLCDRELRYVFSHYITYLVAFIGICTKNYDPNLGYEIYALVLLFVVAFLALIKVIIIVVRSIKDPIRYTTSSDMQKLVPLDSEGISVVHY